MYKNENQINIELNKVIIQIKENPTLISKGLIEAGICDKNGNLTKNYK